MCAKGMFPLDTLVKQHITKFHNVILLPFYLSYDYIKRKRLSPLTLAKASITCYQTCPITRLIRLFILSDKIDFLPYIALFIINNLSDNIFD